jgi:hypothetical protein
MSVTLVGLLIVVVVGFLLGGLLSLRNSTKTGMPSQDVLDRAKIRARELEEQERREQDKDA